MLLDETLDFQESREKVPFVFCGINGICQRFAVVERLEKSAEILQDNLESAIFEHETAKPILII